MTEAEVFTFKAKELNEESNFYTEVNYNVINAANRKVRPVIIDDILLAPLIKDTAHTEAESKEKHNIWKSKTMEQLRKFEEEYRKLAHIS